MTRICTLETDAIATDQALPGAGAQYDAVVAGRMQSGCKAVANAHWQRCRRRKTRPYDRIGNVFFIGPRFDTCTRHEILKPPCGIDPHPVASKWPL